MCYVIVNTLCCRYVIALKLSSKDHFEDLLKTIILWRTEQAPKSVMAGCRDHTIFTQEDLFERGFPVMEEIRRKGKLCDVTLKVSLD